MPICDDCLPKCDNCKKPIHTTPETLENLENLSTEKTHNQFENYAKKIMSMTEKEVIGFCEKEGMELFKMKPPRLVNVSVSERIKFNPQPDKVKMNCNTDNTIKIHRSREGADINIVPNKPKEIGEINPASGKFYRI